MAIMTQTFTAPAQAVRQIVDAEKLCSVINVPEYMRSSRLEVIFFPIDLPTDSRADFEKAVKELQQEAVINGISDMTMEEIDAEIALSRKERKERALK
jgi:hypothetical protein